MYVYKKVESRIGDGCFRLPLVRSDAGSRLSILVGQLGYPECQGAVLYFWAAQVKSGEKITVRAGCSLTKTHSQPRVRRAAQGHLCGDMASPRNQGRNRGQARREREMVG